MTLDKEIITKTTLLAGMIIFSLLIYSLGNIVVGSPNYELRQKLINQGMIQTEDTSKKTAL